MKEKGFTLIELLAVIVILAIISIIAVPIVLNIIDDTKEESNQRSFDLYLKAIENAIDTYEIKYDKPATSFNQLDINYKGSKIECSVEGLYKDRTFYLGGCKVNDSKKEYSYGIKTPVSFEEDSWETIVGNVAIGNTSKYEVGKEKTITLSSTDPNIQGTYTVRVANNSTPTECNTDGFSQTACGFVIEFVDIITTHVMNSSGSSEGGWEKSEMRSFVNNEIYNALPDVVKNNIKETDVVSGGENGKTTNYETKDKLYLLTAKEVYGEDIYSMDNASNNTRQLDYYFNKGVNSNNYSEVIKKKNNIKYEWWLRSVSINDDYLFGSIYSSGVFDGTYYSDSELGVSPAFRLG